MRKTIARVVTAVATGALLATAAPTPAHAVTVVFAIDVDPSDLSANAYVYDSFGGTFTASLTAAGAVTCGVLSPQTLIAAHDQGVGNPVYLRTPGTCTPYNGVVVYDLVWVGVGGTSGHHSVVCIAHLGAVTCSLPGTEVHA